MIYQESYLILVKQPNPWCLTNYTGWEKKRNGCASGIMLPLLIMEKNTSTWYPKHPLQNGCFSWMIPNLYLGNGCFTKLPWKNWLFGVPGMFLRGFDMLFQSFLPSMHGFSAVSSPEREVELAHIRKMIQKLGEKCFGRMFFFWNCQMPLKHLNIHDHRWRSV